MRMQRGNARRMQRTKRVTSPLPPRSGKSASVTRVRLSASTKPGKKKMVRITRASGEECVVHFGQAGASDYTRHKDAARMRRYLIRHAGVNVAREGSKDLQRSLLRVTRSGREDWSSGGLCTAGFWSRWLLWSAPSLAEAKGIIRERFGVEFV